VANVVFRRASSATACFICATTSPVLVMLASTAPRARSARPARLDIEYDGPDFAAGRAAGAAHGAGGARARAGHAAATPGGAHRSPGAPTAAVHAWGQVASYEGEPGPRRTSLNAILAPDVAVVACTAAPRGLRRAPRRALAHLLLPHAHAAPRGRPSSAAARCGGRARSTSRHCRRAPPRCPAPTTSRLHADADRACALRARRCSSALERAGDLLEFWITADTFMRHMNRALVGTMLEVATGRRSEESFRAC
jgi:tRNA pseudouridine38-40 synthase